jgi:hypothetical protein
MQEIEIFSGCQVATQEEVDANRRETALELCLDMIAEHAQEEPQPEPTAEMRRAALSLVAYQPEPVPEPAPVTDEDHQDDDEDDLLPMLTKEQLEKMFANLYANGRSLADFGP